MIIFGLVTGVGTCYFLYLIRGILVPFVVAVITAYILLPVVKALTQKKIPVTLAIIIVYFSVAGLIIIIAFYVFPEIFSELNGFAEAVPHYTVLFQKWIGQIQDNYSNFRLPESIRQAVDETVASLEQRLVQTTKGMAMATFELFSSSLCIVIVPILTFYFLKDHEIIVKKLLSFLPPRYRTELMNLWLPVNGVLRRFIRGHLLVAVIVGILTGLGLALLGVNYAVTLGFIAGLADIIPYFGPIIGAVPAVGLALLQSKKLAIYVMLVMFAIQQLESSIISPKIIGDSVGLHPLVIIFVLLLGGFFFGVLGMLVAVPVAAVLRIVINYLYRKAVSYRVD